MKRRHTGVRRPPPAAVPPAHPDEEVVFVAVAGMRRMLIGYGVPPADVEDVQQQIAMGAAMAIRAGRYRPNPNAKPSQSLKNWLIGIAFKLLSHFHERAHRRYESPVADPYRVATAPSIDPAGQLDARDALRALGEMPEHLRDVLIAFGSGQQIAPFAPFARECGITANVAWKRLRLARLAFAELLAGRRWRRRS